MKAIELSTMRRPSAAHLISFLVLVSSVASASLKLRGISQAHLSASLADSKANPSPAPAPAPAGPPAPVFKMPTPDIRPGVVVRVTDSEASLQQAFNNVTGAYYDQKMRQILGKDFVVVEMGANGGACIHAPINASAVWCLPLNALTPFQNTTDWAESPVASKAFRAIGGPSNVRADITPPGRSAMPWDYSVRGAQLMDPVAPPFDKTVDLDAGQPMPSMRKVRTVISIECMEKLHENPMAPCKPKDFVGGPPQPPPTTPGPVSKAEAEALRKKIQHLQSTIRALSPDKPPVPAKVEPVVHTKHSMTGSMVAAVGKPNQDFDGHRVYIPGRVASERQRTAQGYGEKIGAAELKAKEANHRITKYEQGKSFENAMWDRAPVLPPPEMPNMPKMAR